MDCKEHVWLAGESEGNGDGKWEDSVNGGCCLCLELRVKESKASSAICKLSVCVNVCLYVNMLVYEHVGMCVCVWLWIWVCV